MTTAGSHFVDAHGRRLILRGVNLGGSSKVPVDPPGATHLPDRFYEHRSVSFVGRPFPLDQADEHFSRLRSWGLTLVRLLVTWEAVEHSGPGEYDLEYLDYLTEVVARARQHDIEIIVDFHQDCYSRFTGGDGAPGWTLELAGMDIRRMDETGAAITHQMHALPYEKMIWATNGMKLGAATMFTLFFAGNDFAPQLKVGESSIQDYLQERYLDAIGRVAERLRGFSNLIGYDLMNEPLPGYVECEELTALPGEPRIGATPSALQSMALGDGLPQNVALYRFGATGSRRRGSRLLNPDGVSLWREGCIWRAHGVWDAGPTGSPELLRPDYFHIVRGRRVDFNADYYAPFLDRCRERLRSIDGSSLIFVEPAVGGGHAAPLPSNRGGIVWAPHWYDGVLLMLKDFVPWLGANALTQRPVFGRWFIRRSYARQIGALAAQAKEQGAEAPTLIGEVGIPFDRRPKNRHTRRGLDEDSRAMNRSLRALDENLASYTIWNYTPDNDEVHGDQWNEENLSIYSQATGGRALDAVVRPYPRAVAGAAVRMSFDLRRRRFKLVFKGDEGISTPTEIYLPTRHYGSGVEVHLSDGRAEFLPEQQLLRYYPTNPNALHTIEIEPRSADLSD